MIFLGIDPGLTGAIGVIDSHGKYLGVYDMPTKQKGNGKGVVKREVDCGALLGIFGKITSANRLRAFALLEEQTPTGFRKQRNEKTGQEEKAATGIATTGSLMHTFGVLCCGLVAADIEHERVHPASWKTKIGLRGKPKEASLAMAVTMFPDAPLHRQRDHNRAEAMLLAWYAKQYYWSVGNSITYQAPVDERV